MDAIAVIATSATSVRVVLTAGRIVYQGKWKYIASYIDIGKREAAYQAEFRLLTRFMHLRQVQNDVQEFVNCRKVW